MQVNDLPLKIINYLKNNGTNFIKEIPFHVVWHAFWNTNKAHIFVEASHKVAVIYAYNEETK